MAETNTKATLDKLLADRRPALEALAAAHARREKARQKRAEAEQNEREVEQDYRQAHRAATAAGWGPSELSGVGYPAPTSRARDARRRQRHTTTSSDTTAEASHDQQDG